jgi:hypothetical protein
MKTLTSKENSIYNYDCLVQSTCETYEVKVKFSLEEATKVQRGSRGIPLLFL